MVGDPLELVEQHGLPDPPKAGEELAPTVPAAEEALESYVQVGELLIASHQGWGPGAGSGAVRVQNRVDGRSIRVCRICSRCTYTSSIRI
jgi:hypothetical protein